MILTPKQKKIIETRVIPFIEEQGLVAFISDSKCPESDESEDCLYVIGSQLGSYSLSKRVGKILMSVSKDFAPLIVMKASAEMAPWAEVHSETDSDASWEMFAMLPQHGESCGVAA